MSREPNIYPAQETGHNLLPALKHGTLQEPLVPMEQQVLVNGRFVVGRMREKLRKIEEGDMILCVGDPAAIGIACALAAEYLGGEFTVLKWDRQERTYYPVHINLNAE